MIPVEYTNIIQTQKTTLENLFNVEWLREAEALRSMQTVWK